MIALRNLSNEVAVFFAKQLIDYGNSVATAAAAVRWLDRARPDARRNQIEQWRLKYPHVADVVWSEDGEPEVLVLPTEQKKRRGLHHTIVTRRGPMSAVERQKRREAWTPEKRAAWSKRTTEMIRKARLEAYLR